MKKLVIVLFLGLSFSSGLIFAQSQTGLPNAGLTPESPFYFLDRLGEALREFFTFNPEAKAKLQITFAAERMAEIKVILRTKGVDAKDVDTAISRLKAHIGEAAEIVVKEKSKGKDVSDLATELDDTIDASTLALLNSLEQQEDELETKEEKLEDALKAAHRAGDNAKEKEIAKELGQVKADLELLELKIEDIEDELEEEEEKLEEEMDAQEEAQEAIEEAEEEKKKLIEEAVEEGIEILPGAFAVFDNLISQAKNAFQAGNYQEAKRLAEQAEDILESIEEAIEELEEKMEEKDDQDEEDEDENGEE